MGGSPATPESISQRVRQAAADLACVLSGLQGWNASSTMQLAAALDRIEHALGDPQPHESPYALLGETRDLLREQGHRLHAVLVEFGRVLSDLNGLDLELSTLDRSGAERN